jgi:hypothetical protein
MKHIHGVALEPSVAESFRSVISNADADVLKPTNRNVVQPKQLPWILTCIAGLQRYELHPNGRERKPHVTKRRG